MRTKRAHFQSGDRQLQVINRAGRRGEMEDEIDLLLGQENEVRNVVPNETIIFVARQMSNVRRIPGHQVIDGNDAVSFRQQTIGQMRPKKTGPTGYHRNGVIRDRHAGSSF